MPPLQIRSMPDDLHQWLVEEAVNEHRSVNQQALIMLKEAMRERELTVENGANTNGFARPTYITAMEIPDEEIERRKARRRAAFDEIDELQKTHPLKWADDLPSPVDLIRQDRDR